MRELLFWAKEETQGKLGSGFTHYPAISFPILHIVITQSNIKYLLCGKAVSRASVATRHKKLHDTIAKFVLL